MTNTALQTKAKQQQNKKVVHDLSFSFFFFLSSANTANTIVFPAGKKITTYESNEHCTYSRISHIAPPPKYEPVENLAHTHLFV